MVNVNLSDPAVLSGYIAALCANDTATIKQAEKTLKPFLKTLQCLPVLFLLLKQSPDVNVRHHCALLLKKSINGLYGKCPPPNKEDIKNNLLELVVNEPVKVVRTAIAGVIASVSKSIFAVENDWPALFSLLLQLIQNPNEGLRSLNFNLLEQLCEHVGTYLKTHTKTLAQMFIAGCQDPSPLVSVDAMRAAANYFTFLAELPEADVGNDVMEMETVFAPMLNVMHLCLQRGDEEVVAEGLQVVAECSSMKQPLINNHIDAVLPFILSIIQNKSYDNRVKHAAGDSLVNLVNNRPKLIGKKNLVQPVVEALVKIVATDDGKKSVTSSLFSMADRGQYNQTNDADDSEDDEDYEEFDVQQIAQMTLDAMSISIPSKYFSQPALNVCAQCLDSPDAHMRKAGAAVLGVIAEGSADVMKTLLAQIVPKLINATQDREFFVRECACFALGQLSEHCQPDILYYHKSVLPAIFTVLEDEKPSVQSTSCYVVEMFAEGLQPETLRPFLPKLVERLLHILQSAQPSTKEMALAALAATAVASETDFIPFAEACCVLIAPFMFLTDVHLYTLRGRALECWSHFAIAIGREPFQRYFETGMQSATQALEIDDWGLREFSYIFFANCAKIMQDGFIPFLPQLVGHLVDVSKEHEVELIVDEDDEDEDEGANTDPAGDEDIDEDESDQGIQVRDQAFINAKKGSLTALGALAEYTKAAFAPYLELVMRSLYDEELGSLNSMYGAIRGEAIILLQYCFAVSCLHNNILEEPHQSVLMQLNPTVESFVRMVMATFINSMASDPEKVPASCSCDAVAFILQKIGVAALAVKDDSGKSFIDPLVDTLANLLAEKAECQLRTEEQDEEEDDDHDHVLIDSVSDLIGTLAKSMGADFIPYFDRFVKPLLKYTKPSRSFSDRSMAIGCFAEVFEEFGTSSMKYAELILPVLKQGLSDEMEPVRRNSAFCVGVLIEATGTALSGTVLPILQALHPLCIRPAHQQGSDMGGADIDNAVSAVCRMINTMGPTIIPIAQVVPVIVAALPLRSDVSEGPKVYGCLGKLMLANEPTVMSLLPQILSLFAENFKEGVKVEDETKVVIRDILKQAVSSPQAGVVSAALGQIGDPAVRTILEKVVQS